AFAFASIAMVESSCNPEATNKHGTNGRADGLFQLEYSKDLRRQSGRDKVFCRTRIPYKTSKLDFQIECSLSIIKDVHCGSSRIRPLNWRGGYWEKLRQNGRITQKIKR